jgi:hypothetical protein
MATTADYDIFDSITHAPDVVEEPRVFDGNKLMEERYSSASVGKRAVITHQYSGNKCCGFELTLEDV